ncbi:hypothetical protein B0H17DRAFT_514360 [Mycena rosella]|uniref:Uncharacterized protein n=1 Tax=Mycena rosella TaxID=1033263 RepID=A0AAD7BVQ7_MYCRO|nr:hypothetical protein B0H17DRAFT_514360 [Mycena rosella]
MDGEQRVQFIPPERSGAFSVLRRLRACAVRRFIPGRRFSNEFRHGAPVPLVSGVSDGGVFIHSLSHMSSFLPQTNNALSHTERSRLVRSNRKLQALLGEAPQVIEAAVATARKHTDAGDMDPTPIHRLHSRSDDGSSSAPSPSSRRRNSPSTLTLLSMPTHKHAFSVSSPPLTPLSPTMSITINTPLSTPPSSSGLGRSFTSAKDMRRRHMAKLTRTLGENIAPELVVADPVAPRLTRAKSIAALHDAPAPPPSMRPLKSPTLGRSASMRHLDSATLGRSFSTVSHNSRIMLVPPRTARREHRVHVREHRRGPARCEGGARRGRGAPGLGRTPVE